MIRLLGVIESFIESVAAGDRSWWPFIISVVVLTAGLVAIRGVALSDRLSRCCGDRARRPTRTSLRGLAVLAMVVAGCSSGPPPDADSADPRARTADWGNALAQYDLGTLTELAHADYSHPT